MGMDGFAQLRLDPSLPAQPIDGVPRERLQGFRPREEPRARLRLLPILPQEGQQPGREHDTAIPLAFALPDTENHTATVDISDLEVTEFGDPQTSGIERRQYRPGFERSE